MIEVHRSSFWASCRKALPALVLFSLLALLIGCGGGGGGGGGNGGGNGGSIPPAPTNLTAAPGNGQITLNWNASTGASSYNVLRALAPGGPYTTLVNGHTLTSYTNSSLTNGTTYFYKVTATNVNGTSGDSNIASATPTAGGGGPSWLPANTIFYRSVDDADPTATDIRRVNPDGSGDALFRLVPNQFTAVTPNPNVSNQVVFAYTEDAVVTSNSVYALYKNTTVSLTGAQKLTNQVSSPFNVVGSIGFTTDGQKIFFTAATGSDHGLYIMNPNGTGLERECSADDAHLSPDGTKILISQAQGSQNDLFYLTTSQAVVAGPGTAAVNPVLQTTTVDEIMPQWSKDGTKIVFSGATPTDPIPNFEVFIVNFGSSSTTQLTANGDDNFSPSASADGTQVAFARISGSNVANNGVYRVSSGGGSSTPVILTTSILGPVYWTSNTGRAVGGGMPFALSRSLKVIPRN